MAFLMNPLYGTQPGAARGLNWWTGPQFNISELLAAMPPPPPPLAPTRTPQDEAAQAGAIEMRGDVGGAEGGTGTAAQGGVGGQLQQEATRGQLTDPFRNPSTTPPSQFDPRYGLLGSTVGSVAGMASGIPGFGMLGGTIGENVDLAQYAANLRAAGIPFSPDYLSATAAGLTGLPFGLGNVLGTGARQQAENARRDALAGRWGNLTEATWGLTDFPTNAPQMDWVADMILSNPETFGVSSVSPFPEITRAFDPATLGRDYGYGAVPGAMEGSTNQAAPQGQTGYASGIYGSGVGVGADAGSIGSGGPPTGGGGYADTAGNSNAGADWGGGDRFGFARGGLIGAPQDPPTQALIGPVRPGLPIDPPGPDNTMITAQTGEGVMTRAANTAYPGLLAAANAGTLDPGRVKGLLTPAGKGRSRTRGLA